MTPTQIARRSDALYADGTCGRTRRVLCDMLAQRESDLEDARAENAKLRSELESVGTASYLYGRSDLKAENARLRELCKEGYRYTRKLIDEFLGEPEADEDFMALEDRLRELGVEPY